MQPLAVPNMLHTAQISREDSQREIDAQEHALLQQILKLRTQRNTFAYISMLPQDLLVEIFLLVHVDSSVKEWHHITHVCRYWRHTAISTPILWTAPPLYRYYYTRLMLERSKDANLRIYFKEPPQKDTLSSVLEHVGRISTLEIYAQQLLLATDRFREFSDRLVSSSHLFSRIQSLDIAYRGRYPDSWHWKLPSGLIPRSTSMRSIKLHFVCIDWHMLTSFDLHTLELWQVKISEKVSYDTLLNTLQQMPRLQYVVLGLMGSIVHHKSSSCDAIKTLLPHLQGFIGIDDNPSYIPHLLSRLELPNLCKLELHASDDFDGYNSATAGVALATILAGGRFKVTGDLLVNASSIALSEPDDQYFYIEMPLGDNSLRDLENQRSQRLLEHIIPIFTDLSRVVVGLPLNTDELTRYFSNMTQLRMITILYLSHIAALTGALTNDDLHTFPSLDTIGFWDLAWDDIEVSEMDDLCDVLVRRTGQITIKSNDPPPEWVMEVLQGTGIRVYFDKAEENYGF